MAVITGCATHADLDRSFAEELAGCRPRDRVPLRWEGQEHSVLWISGDTVLHDGVRKVDQPERFLVRSKPVEAAPWRGT